MQLYILLFSTFSLHIVLLYTLQYIQSTLFYYTKAALFCGVLILPCSHVHRLSGLEPLEAIAREFDRLKNPLEDWLLQQAEAFDGLPPVEIAVEELQKEQRSLGGLKEGIAGRKADVEKLEELASNFEMETEVWNWR